MTRRALERFKIGANPAKHLPTPEILPSSHMSVDGHTVRFIKDLQGDFAPAPANTPVWVPSLRTLIADDLVFHGVHPWLGNSTSRTRAAWRKSLQRLVALRPRRLIPGHQFGHEANSPKDDLDFADSYIVAFGQTAKTAFNAEIFMRAMESRFPDLKGRLLLEYGAKSVYETYRKP